MTKRGEIGLFYDDGTLDVLEGKLVNRTAGGAAITVDIRVTGTIHRLIVCTGTFAHTADHTEALRNGDTLTVEYPMVEGEEDET